MKQLTDRTIEFIEEIERVTGARVSLISTGFMQHRGVIDRRTWCEPSMGLSLAVARALFPEVGGPHGRWYTALVLYGSELPTDDD